MKTTAAFIPVVLACLCLTGCQHIQKLFGKKDAPPPQPFTTVAQPTLEQITSAISFRKSHRTPRR